jgi:hypothetical protein
MSDKSNVCANAQAEQKGNITYQRTSCSSYSYSTAVSTAESRVMKVTCALRSARAVTRSSARIVVQVLQHALCYL